MFFSRRSRTLRTGSQATLPRFDGLTERVPFAGEYQAPFSSARADCAAANGSITSTLIGRHATPLPRIPKRPMPTIIPIVSGRKNGKKRRNFAGRAHNLGFDGLFLVRGQ
jgi:hypothetical protein